MHITIVNIYKTLRSQKKLFERAYQSNLSLDSRLSTPSLSSSDGKGKRPLSFSPLPETLIKSPLTTTTELRPMPIIQQKPLAPLIEPNEIQCQWAGCDLLFSTPIQLTEVKQKLNFPFNKTFLFSIFVRFISIVSILGHGFANGNHVLVIINHLNLSIHSSLTYEHIRKIVHINARLSIARKHSHVLNIFVYTNVHTLVSCFFCVCFVF